jgi:phenylacetate-coenzyme A ligase PaaK-like adenylate-forming protein
MWVMGEPVTPAKAEPMRQVGARVISGYGMVEAGMIGYACANPVDVTDVHLQRDALALFTYPYRVEPSGVTVPAFHLTTLLDTAPLLLLNLQTDDYGIVEERACGCELETCGYTPHLRDIRSYSKLVGEGVTLIGNEMVHILERVLPARFGGTALDYQLLEQEDERGFTRLYLVISPRVEIQDERQVLAVVHQALGASSPMADAARAVWQQTDTIRIIRQEPIWTATGKFLPLHVQRHQR